MSLNAQLTLKLDASSLVQGLIGELAGHAGSLNAIPNPASADQMSQAGSAGGSFLPASLVQSISQTAGVVLPASSIPATIAQIESVLAAIEQLTTRDLGADLSQLATQLTTELESANQQGIPGILLNISNILQNSPVGGALGGILSQLTSSVESLGVPPELKLAVPAFVSTARVLAGLMVYETVLAEGERLTAFMANQFNADRAAVEVAKLKAAFQSGSQTLAQRLAAIDPADLVLVEGAAAAVENAAAQLNSLSDYVSQGMGFGEATLVHFDPGRAQVEITAAGALLHNPDLGDLRRVMEALARLAAPVTQLMDPGDAAARGLEGVIQLAEAQVAQAAASIRNFNADVLVQPLTGGITAITAPLRTFSDLVSRIVTEVRVTLDQVRAAVAALPIDAIATAIRTILEPVTQALQFLTNLVDEIRAALEAAAQTALTALGQVESGVDEFKAQLTALFGEARQFIDDLHIEQVVSTISDKVNEFVGLLQQAQMKPYFDAASSAIDGAADVISNIPFNLVPESMKADLDTALAPVREVDAAAVQTEIETLLAIGPDGFQLRGDLETALAGIQAKFEEILATLDAHHPRQYLQQLDQELSQLAIKIQALAPQLTLEPVQQAIDQLKGALNGFDLERELQPVQAVFDQAIAALDQYSPAQLLAPVQARVAEARTKLETTIRIDDWRPTIDGLAATALAQLDVLDTAALETLLESLFQQLREEAGSVNLGFGKWLGMIVAGLMRGAGMRLSPGSFESVLRWLSGAPGGAELSARATNIATALETTLRAVQGFDPAALTDVVNQANQLAAAAQSLASKLDAGSDLRFRLEAAGGRLDAGAVFSGLATNRTRYLQTLVSASALGDTLRRTGMSEADVALDQLRQAFTPLAPLIAKLRMLVSYLGLTGTEAGFQAVLQRVFQVVTPARLVALVSTLVGALRDRLRTLLDQILAPIRAAIDDLKNLLALIDLQPIIDSLNAIFLEVKTQILAYSPAVLLHDPLAAFNTLKQDLLAFNPLAAILAILNELRDTAARIVGKLSAEKLLESPLAIYDEILGAMHQLNIETLLGPVLDALDNIAQQVDEGLTETVAAFDHLQQALPPPGGGSSVSVSVSVT